MTRALVACAFALVSCTAIPAAVATSAPRATPTPTLFSTTTAPTATHATSTPAFRYVAIGASDTVGVGASDPRTGSWPARLAARLPSSTDYVNLGVSGSLAAQASREQLPTALGLRPQLATVWLAVNDLNASLPAADYAAALRSVVEPLVSRTAARIFVGNVPDLRAVPVYANVDKARLLAGIQAYNDVIAVIAARNPDRVHVVDLFTGSAALVSTGTVSPDGFHPSDEGYQLIADRFASAMRASGVPLRA